MDGLRQMNMGRQYDDLKIYFIPFKKMNVG